MATIIDGKKLAGDLRKKISADFALLKKKNIVPGLAFVMVGDHPPSQIYVRNKQLACDEVGIHNILKKLPADISEQELLANIATLNNDPKIHGILVQLPIPLHINTKQVLMTINPDKDVDGMHPMNLGKLYLNLPGLRPCTPQGIIAMIESLGIDLKGKQACVVGRSAI